MTRFSLNGFSTERLGKCKLIYLSTFTSYSHGEGQSMFDGDARCIDGTQGMYGLWKNNTRSVLGALWTGARGRTGHVHK